MGQLWRKKDHTNFQHFPASGFELGWGCKEDILPDAPEAPPLAFYNKVPHALSKFDFIVIEQISDSNNTH